ncbi:hypothetical protein PLICRDRAFT_611877 [Plicaturopsis crispa FD-325 SS-3]|nr:hypothetical protein PLICRDRAFT_611877 [Plicaturopsis crispa FD-325 SS-3]
MRSLTKDHVLYRCGCRPRPPAASVHGLPTVDPEDSTRMLARGRLWRALLKRNTAQRALSPSHISFRSRGIHEPSLRLQPLQNGYTRSHRPRALPDRASIIFWRSGGWPGTAPAAPSFSRAFQYSHLRLDAGAIYHVPPLCSCCTLLDRAVLALSSQWLAIGSEAPIAVEGSLGMCTSRPLSTILGGAFILYTVVSSHTLFVLSLNRVYFEACDSIVFSEPSIRGWTPIEDVIPEMYIGNL